MEVRVLTLRNIARNQLPINVDPPLEEEGTDVTGTDITSGFATLFDGEGTIILQPGKTFVIEEDRLNLGQIENLVKLGQLRTELSVRSVSNPSEG